MRPVLFSLQVFVLMCLPMPQSSYVGVGLGQRAGLSMALLLLLYTLSDFVVFAFGSFAMRRLGPAGLRRLNARLPRPLDRRFSAARLDAERRGRSRAALPAVFIAGSVSLHLAALVATVSRARVLPAALSAVSADVIQFTATVALAGTIAHTLPFAGGNWLALMVAPLLMGGVPITLQGARLLEAYLRRPRPAFFPVTLLPAPVAA